MPIRLDVVTAFKKLILPLTIAVVFFIGIYGSAQAQVVTDETEVHMGGSSASDDLLVESTPVKPHENVYIEDVEAQAKEAREEVRSAQKEVYKTNKEILKVRGKNYGDKKHLQKETLKSLEKKKKADAARVKIEQQREKVQNDILAYEKKRLRAKERADKSEENVEKAKVRLTEAKQNRANQVTTRATPPPQKKYRRVKVNFGNEGKGKSRKDLNADAS